MVERLLFKFYKSYFTVASELSDKDRLSFYDALMNKQFNGIEPELKGMANFAYISQKHSINAQVKGWEDKTGIQINNPIEPPTIPPIEPPTTEEEGKEKGKEKEKVKRKTKVFTPPTILEVKQYFKENGYTEYSGEKAFKYYNVADWHDSKGTKVSNWKQKMQSVWFKDENKSKDHGLVKNRMVHYKLFGFDKTHTEKAYLDNLKIEGEQNVIFLNYVD